MKTVHYLFSLGLLSFVFSSCGDIVEYEVAGPYTDAEYTTLNQNLNLPSTYFFYSQAVGFPDSKPNNQANAMATLGRVLFYDTQLSVDNTVSCGSCHQQALAFSDNIDFSHGVNGNITTRNSLALGVFQSFATYSEDPGTQLFWDGRVNTLSEQMQQSLENPNEMGMPLEDLIPKLNNLDYYQILTRKAFGVDKMESWMPFLAMETFINSLTSNDAKIDRPIFAANASDPTETWQNFTAAENQGKNIFINNCNTCHSAGIFEGTVDFASNGLDLIYLDDGVGKISNRDEDNGVFKVPSLRNIELTAPYMHDGRFGTLNEVVNFYSDGIQGHSNLHPALQNESGDPKRLNFSEVEKSALIAFLLTMTDEKILTEAKWSDPFL
ncbi:MAG: c-type cytochrome [Bacteroidota bacterium]|nr:c-type cytochrome [Bacteroidota bacterium]